MYNKHENINTPDKDTEIWRYLDSWKFWDIIDNKKIYLSRADLFEDKYEGRVLVKNLKEKAPEHDLIPVDEYSNKVLKKETFISCWTLEKDITYPLWKIYTDYRNGMSIKTTISNLIDSLSVDKNIQRIGRVGYKNNDLKKYAFGGNTYQLFLEKRKFFEYEKEVRIIMEKNYNNEEDRLNAPSGLFVDVKLDTLIQEINLAPLANESFKKIIELKLDSLRLKIPINYTEI